MLLGVRCWLLVIGDVSYVACCMSFDGCLFVAVRCCVLFVLLFAVRCVLFVV